MLRPCARVTALAVMVVSLVLPLLLVLWVTSAANAQSQSATTNRCLAWVAVGV